MEFPTEYQLFLGKTTYLCFAGTYVGAVFVFEILRQTLKLPRIQRPPNDYELEKCFKMAATNLVWLFFVTTFLAGRFLEKALADYDDPLPGFGEWMVKFAIFFLVDDCWFYLYHRVVHTFPILYINIHKPHHIFTAPFPAVSFAVHPFELALQAFGATLAPLGLFYGKTHPIVFWSFIVVRFLQGVEDHLGFELSWSPTHLLPSVFGGTKFHDLHHQKFNCNYASIFSFLDKAFGTSSD